MGSACYQLTVCSGTAVERYSRLLRLIKPTGNILITPNVDQCPHNSGKEHLSIVICGHVGSGRRTNTGRLIFALGGLPERGWGKAGGSFAFAFYMGRQKVERERNVAIAYPALIFALS